MNFSKYYREMHLLASTYAHRADVVQGAGGNFSVKVDNKTMLIKASGMSFNGIDAKGNALVPVNYRIIKNYLASNNSRHCSESDHMQMIKSATACDIDEGERPSMEVWFHVFLRKYVLHTHSACINILMCAQEGSAMVSDIFNERSLPFRIISYHNPGYELGDSMFKQIKRKRDMPSVIFLENHGIIVTTDTLQECIRLHEQVIERVSDRLTIRKIDIDMRELDKKESDDFSSLVLFPDQIVYPDDREIRATHRFILKHMRSNNLTPQIIPNSDARVVENLESEKHRRNYRHRMKTCARS